jgi:hypothetical protein
MSWRPDPVRGELEEIAATLDGFLGKPRENEL